MVDIAAGDEAKLRVLSKTRLRKLAYLAKKSGISAAVEQFETLKEAPNCKQCDKKGGSDD